MSDDTRSSMDETVGSEQESRDVSRRTLIRRTAMVAAVAAPVGLLAACGGGTRAVLSTTRLAQPQRSDVVAAPARPLQNTGAAFAEIQADEVAHVSFLANALGSSARPEPTFKGLQQSSVSAFANLSKAFENVGVGAYLMAIPAISSKTYVAAALSIATIEARHCGFVDYLTDSPLSANGAFDKPLSQSAIVSAVSPFISSLNGGPDPSGTLSSDADILNFALLLEYLERDFYNINVPIFYGGSTPGNG